MIRGTTQSPFPPDSEAQRLVRWLPASIRPFAVIARFDRPIGWWLLFWPCAWGVLLAGGAAGQWPLLIWLLVGAISMRGAGCVYNDIVDRDLDAQVERTRMRPLPSGALSVRAAWLWLVLLCLVGLLVLAQLNGAAQLTAIASLAPVAAYPFMKRITWWPQIWLGLVFSWGALVGWMGVTSSVTPSMAALYAGSICWVVGYDTIYALQDREDDALIGIRSSARRLGRRVRLGVGLAYVAAIVCWSYAVWQVRPQLLACAALIPAALHLTWQTVMLDAKTGANALSLFRSNRFAGLLVALACLVVGNS